MKQASRNKKIPTLAIVVVLLGLSGVASSQPHEAKAVFADQMNWPPTAPAELSLEKFRPFQAVYDRSYTQGSGPKAGEKREDRVIVHADEVGWEGRQAVAITVLDTGAARYPDTNMRQLLMVVGLDQLDLLFEIGPAPGKAMDYYLVRTGDELLMSMVDTGAQKLMPRKMPMKQRGFGPGTWAMASMELEPGLEIQLAPYYSPQANPISQSSYGRVIGRRTIEDGSQGTHEAWLIEAPGWYGPDSPKVLHMFVKDSPPYYLGTEIYNHETKESSRFVWLKSTVATGR